MSERVAFLSWVNSAGKAETLYFDVVRDIVQEFVSTPTEYAVEEGINVTDHVKREPRKVSLEVYVSNAPIIDLNNRGSGVRPLKLEAKSYVAPFDLTPGALYRAGGNAARSVLGGLGGDQTITSNVLQWDQEFDAVADTLRTLERLRDTGQLVNVFTSTRLHASMLLTHFSQSKNAQTGTGADFKLDFQEIRKVTLKLVPTPAENEPRMMPDVKKGGQAPVEVPEGPKKSALLATAQEVYEQGKKYLPKLP